MNRINDIFHDYFIFFMALQVSDQSRQGHYYPLYEEIEAVLDPLLTSKSVS